MEPAPINRGPDSIKNSSSSKSSEEMEERLEACKKFQKKLNKLKGVLERWEKDFRKKTGRKPEKPDLVDRPTMAEKFKLYHTLKGQLFKEYPKEIKILNPKASEKPSSSRGKAPEALKKIVPKADGPTQSVHPNNAQEFEIPESDDESLKNGVEEESTYLPGTPPDVPHDSNAPLAALPQPLSAANIAIQRDRLEMALNMESCIDITQSHYPIYDPPRFVAQDEEVSSDEEEPGPMDVPPPQCFKKLYASTPLFWGEIMDKYNVSKDDPFYNDPSLRQKAYAERKFIQDSLLMGFEDLVDSRVKVLRLTSSPYDRRHSPFSLPKLAQRIRGHKSLREMQKEADRPIFPMMPGFHTRACSNSKTVYAKKLPCDAENNPLPIQPYRDWEDDMFPAPQESGPKEFPNQLEDPRYIERENQRKAQRLEKEREKAPLVHRALPVRIPKKLKNQDLVSTNFVRADMRRGKMRTGLSSRGTKAKARRSRYGR